MSFQRSAVQANIPAFLLLMAWSLLAHGAEAELKANPFWESIQPDVDVSGIVVVGLTTGSLVSGSDLPAMYIRPPAALAGSDICLTVQSRDGVYLSRNTYILPDTVGDEPIDLPYDQSDALDLLKQYDDKRLGISAVAGSCQTSTPIRQFLKPYGQSAADFSGVNLMINGFGATDVFYRAPELNMDGSCEQLRGGRTTVFDFWCHIDLPASLGQSATIRIDRERYGRELAPATLTLTADGF